MTRATRRTSRNIATIWPITGKSDYGQITYGAPYTVSCTFSAGSTRQYNDSQGQMYIPKSIYWYELPEQGIPSLNDFIALGDHVLEPTPNNVPGAETIRNRVREDSAVLGDTDDVMVLT